MRCYQSQNHTKNIKKIKQSKKEKEKKTKTKKILKKKQQKNKTKQKTLLCLTLEDWWWNAMNGCLVALMAGCIQTQIKK